MTPQPKTLVQIFKWPAIVTGLSLAGLVLALLIEGPADIATALAVGAPVIVIAWALLQK